MCSVRTSAAGVSDRGMTSATGIAGAQFTVYAWPILRDLASANAVASSREMKVAQMVET